MQPSSFYLCTWCYGDENHLGVVERRKRIRNTLKRTLWNSMTQAALGLKPNVLKKVLIYPYFNYEDKLILRVIDTLYNHMLNDYEQDTLNWVRYCNIQHELTLESPAFKGNLNIN